MFFIDTLDVTGLGNRSYLAGGERAAVVVDPPRDIDQVIAAAARRGVRIAYVVETHVHNDYVTGGLELARVTGAAYLVPAGAGVAYPHVAVGDGDRFVVDGRIGLRALATPGHTPHHTAYALEENGAAVAVFTGGSLLTGTVGRPDLVEPRLTEGLARAQYASAHRLAEELPDETVVLPTHGFGSFCSSRRAEGAGSTIGEEKASNEVLLRDVDTFVADLLAGLDDIPAYYTHMGPANAAGPAPVDLTPPAVADAEEIAARLAAGEWVIDLRNRVAFAEGHVAGSLNFEAEGQLATYLAWLIPWGRPVTLLAASPDQLAAAQRELVRVGIDRPAAAATGEPENWTGERLASFPRATFADLAAISTAAPAARPAAPAARPAAPAARPAAPAARPAAPVAQPAAPAAQPEAHSDAGLRHPPAPRPVVLDVRRRSERTAGFVDGSVHIPLHTLPRRLHEVPDGQVWVHCAGGMRAAIAASLLDAAGREVVAIDDAFDAAGRAGLVVRTYVDDGDSDPAGPVVRTRAHSDDSAAEQAGPACRTHG